MTANAYSGQDDIDNCNVFRHLDILDGDLEPNGESALARNHRGRVQAAESGLFRYEGQVALGEFVTADTPVGTLYDSTTYEVLQEVPVVAGDTLVNVALVRE